MANVSRGRAWVFTINNPSENEHTDLVEKLSNESVYGIIGQERGSSGTKHLQGYVRFKNPRAFGGVRELIGGRGHLEQAKGTDAQNKVYCSKENKAVEWGTPSSQGNRTDLHQVRQIVETTRTMKQVIEVATNLQQVKYAETILKYLDPRRDAKPIILWYHGATGTGKTRTAINEAGARYWISGENLKWFDGYDGHEHVIIDDFREDFCSFTFLLRLLDRYPLRVAVKGGFREWIPTRIWVTSEFHPTNVFTFRRGDVNQLVRRCDAIKEFKELVLDTEVVASDPDSEDELQLI